METMKFEFAGGPPAPRRALAGVVGSGDLEVLLEPQVAGRIDVSVTTSVDGMGRIWKEVLTRVLDGKGLPAAKIAIHDFGATPGVVRMRLEQAFELTHVGREVNA